jgi:hypothetical protein
MRSLWWQLVAVHLIKGRAIWAMFMRPANLNIMHRNPAVFSDVFGGQLAHFSGGAPGP